MGARAAAPRLVSIAIVGSAANPPARTRPSRGMTETPGWGRRLSENKPADGPALPAILRDPSRAPCATEIPIGMVEFGLRLLKGPWATAALICLAAFVVLFALAGQTLNAPFVYTAPR
jgi:hypothetical protein